MVRIGDIIYYEPAVCTGYFWQGMAVGAVVAIAAILIILNSKE